MPYTQQHTQYNAVTRASTASVLADDVTINLAADGRGAVALQMRSRPLKYSAKALSPKNAS